MSSRSVSLPQFSPTPHEIDDVEVLRMGVLAPMTGFGGADSTVQLHVPLEVADWGEDRGGIEIVDTEGVPLAEVRIEERYPVSDTMVGIKGEVVARPGSINRPFSDLYMAPSGSRVCLPPETVTVAVTGALTQSDLDDIAAQADDAPVLFVVLNGEGTVRGLTPHGLIKATLTAARRFPTRQVVVVPAAKRSKPEIEPIFRERVLSAYAPGEVIIWPEGRGEVPDDIAAVVAADRPSGTHKGAVVFFTGLSGSGKSSIAQGLRNLLLESGARTVSLLDGDRVRHNLSRGLTFSRQDRDINVERIAWVAAEAARHGGLAICSPIAPHDRTRKVARALADEAGAEFVLVHVSTPLAVCEARDRKGLYARARRGEIEEFTGITSRYEKPKDAELVIDTTDQELADSLRRVVSDLVDRKLIPEFLLSQVG